MTAELSYDPQAGAAYVRFTREPVARTRADWLQEGVNVDLDEHGEVVGFEFLNITTVRTVVPLFNPPPTPNPLDYVCPNCNAQPGKYCSVPSSRGRKQVPWVHSSREELAQ